MSGSMKSPTVASTVGVVIPCHNYARFLPTCLESVLAQPGVDLDVLVIDDASSDSSSSVANSYAARDSRVRVISHSTNAGHIRTYNEGLAKVRGEFLVLLSADDALAPKSLMRATQFMAINPRIGFTYGPVTAFAGDVPPQAGSHGFNITKVWPGPVWLKRRSKLMTNCVVSPEVVIRRSVYDRVGPYNSALPHTGDLAMWMRAAAVSDVAYLHGSPAAFYRKHADNMHRQIFQSGTVDGMLVDLIQRRLTADAVFAEMTGSVADTLHNSARTALANEALAAACRAYTWGLTDVWPVRGLVDFAAEIWPEYRNLPTFRALERRRGRGVSGAVRYPPYIVTERVLELRRRWLTLRQKWTGT